VRKSFCFFIALILVTLCGCSNGGTAVTAISKGISFNAEIKCENENYEFKVKIPENSNMILETVSPKKIAGSVFKISNSGATFVCGEIEHKTSLESLPKSSPVGFIYSVFSDIASRPVEAEFENDEYFITGETANYDYKLILGNTGLPIKIYDNKNNITAIIKEASIDTLVF